MTKEIQQNTIKGILNEWIVEFLVNTKEKKFKRIDARRLWPLAVIGLIVSVTITHEATYAGSFEINGLEFIGWPYALAVNAAILIGEYFTQWESSKKYGWATFWIATIASGVLNVAYIKPWTHMDASILEAIFAWIYSLIPTTLIVSLGFLSSTAAKLAKTQERKWQDNEHKEYECFCGEKFSKPIQLANHTKKHIKQLKDNDITSGPKGLQYLKSIYPNSEPKLQQINGWVSSYAPESQT